MYIPKVNYIYPENTDEQLIKVEHKRKVTLNEKYYKHLKSFLFKIGHFFFRILFTLIAIPVVKIRYHLKVEGKQNIKKLKKHLRKHGFITVSNHVFFWDYLALCATMNMGLPNVPAWEKLAFSKFGEVFSQAGVIPIPQDVKSFKKFYAFIDDIFKENKWIHIYPETGLWYYYVPIRPFKRGACYFAYKYDKPIIPVAFSFRERTGISKHIFKKDPFVTSHIGEPIYPDKSLPSKIAIDKMTEEVRTAIMRMVGIESEEENQRLMKECYKYEKGHYYTNL